MRWRSNLSWGNWVKTSLCGHNSTTSVGNAESISREKFKSVCRLKKQISLKRYFKSLIFGHFVRSNLPKTCGYKDNIARECNRHPKRLLCEEKERWDSRHIARSSKCPEFRKVLTAMKFFQINFNHCTWADHLRIWGGECQHKWTDKPYKYYESEHFSKSRLLLIRRPDLTSWVKPQGRTSAYSKQRTISSWYAKA